MLLFSSRFFKSSQQFSILYVSMFLLRLGYVLINSKSKISTTIKVMTRSSERECNVHKKTYVVCISVFCIVIPNNSIVQKESPNWEFCFYLEHS